jgi:hypothetical protein
MHLKLDCPDSMGACGSSDTAGLAKRFFEAENCHFFCGSCGWHRCREARLREATSKFCHPPHDCQQQGAIALSERLVDVHAFEQLCIETYLVLVEAFPWASVPQLVHHVLALLAERIRTNGG